MKLQAGIRRCLKLAVRKHICSYFKFERPPEPGDLRGRSRLEAALHRVDRVRERDGGQCGAASAAERLHAP